MKRNSVSYRVAVLFCSNSVLQLMGFAYRMALSKYAGTYALGLNSLVMQIYGVIVSVCISGTNVAVSALAARTEDDSSGTLIGSAAIILCALWAAAVIPAVSFGRTIENVVFRESGMLKTLLLMPFCILMTGFENILKSFHIGKGRAAVCGVSETLEQGVRFALVIALIKHLRANDSPDKVFLIMLGMTASEFVSVGFLSVSYYIGFSRVKTRPKAKVPLMLRDIAVIAFPASLTAVSSTAFASAGSLILPTLLAGAGLTREEAISSVGTLNTVFVPLTMLPMAFAGAASAVIMPEISFMTERGSSPDKLIRRAFVLVGAVGFAASAVIFILSDRISARLFGVRSDRIVFLLLSIKAFVLFVQAVSTASLNGLLLQKKVLLFAVVGESYQLALILLLTPVLGIKGYCVGMAAGELLRLILNAAQIREALNNCGFYGRDMLKSNSKNTL